IFCQGKTPEGIAGIVGKLVEAGQDCLATRLDDTAAAYLKSLYPQAEQDRIARTFWLPTPQSAVRVATGQVLVLTAGTSDLPVAQEAFVTARALGADVKLRADVGVAGIHRLLRYRDDYAQADAIVVV